MSETRKIAAILAIDVVGYSRLMGEGGRDGAGALATRTVHSARKERMHDMYGQHLVGA